MKPEEQITLFRDLYLEVHPHLEKYCRALIYDHEEAKELMSETISIGIRKMNDIRDMSKFKHYLFGIASNLFKKKISRQKSFIEINEINQFPLTDSDPSEQADIQNLYKALDRLPVNEKEIIALFELSGFSLNEISDMKNMNLSTVKTHLSRGRKHLMMILNPGKEKIYS